MRFYIHDSCIDIRYSFLLIIAFAIITKSYDFIYVLLFSSLHEIGHLVTLYLLGGNFDTITLGYYGIGLKHSVSMNPFHEFVFLLSGILVNVFFVIIDYKRQINLAIAFVNILPVYPLDGGRMLKLIFNRVFNLTVSDKVYKCFSVIIVIALIALSIYIKSASLALISVYIIVYSLNNSID